MLTTTLNPRPKRPTPRNRFIEFHEQPYVPAYIRRPIQDMLTLAWTNTFWPLQKQSPSELIVDVLEEQVSKLTRTGQAGGRLSVVDFCSGAGGPIQTIERIMNKRRSDPIPFLLTDIHPHTSAWTSASLSSPTHSLSYIPVSVDATSAPPNLLSLAQNGSASSKKTGLVQRKGKGPGVGTEDQTFRTFFLAFHHFDEQLAVGVIKDAMLSSDGLGIFELQKFDFGSLLTITGLWPLTWIFTPTLKPTLLTLFFTYIIPIIPFILVLDGYTSAYRSRSFEHIRYLAMIAHEQLTLEGKLPKGGKPWVWEEGSGVHTWPGGRAYWVLGRRADCA